MVIFEDHPAGAAGSPPLVREVATGAGIVPDLSLKDQVAKLNSNPQIAIQKQTQALIAEVGRLIDLPKDEAPTVANVSDASQAKKQSAFFNNAQNGDKVLMYVKAGEAILYRPSTNKIILVTTLDSSGDTTPSNSGTKPTTTH